MPITLGLTSLVIEINLSRRLAIYPCSEPSTVHRILNSICCSLHPANTALIAPVILILLSTVTHQISSNCSAKSAGPEFWSLTLRRTRSARCDCLVEPVLVGGKVSSIPYLQWVRKDTVVFPRILCGSPYHLLAATDQRLPLAFRY
jgi:hypothetical protein